MKEEVFITGHRNPDSDSICSALAYAELKNKRGECNAIPIRLGELNQETKFILNYFGLEPPMYKDTIKPQVGDLSIDTAYSVSKDISLNKALNLIQNNNISSLIVVDENETLIGIVSLSNITKSYMDIWDDGILGRSKTTIDNIIEVLSAELIYEPEKIRNFENISVYAMEVGDVEETIHEGDIVIVGNRPEAQKDAIQRDISVLIITGGGKADEEALELAKKHGVNIISTEFNSYMTARLLPQSVPVSYVMTTEDLVYFHKDDYVEYVKVIMGKSRYRAYPIIDHKNRVVGSISRYHLISNRRKQLILVDHNEKNQSIPDIEVAEIKEIIDHHRVANISTTGPIYFRNEPVGSTSTIISRIYFEHGIRPSKKIAGILSAAIISDTLLFRSPTTTDTDRRMLDRMSKIAGIDIDKFAMEMFKAGTSLENKKPEDLLTSDVKLFTIEDEKVRIGQAFTMDLDNIGFIKKPLIERMEEMRKDYQEDLFVFILTDIFEERSEIIVSGKHSKAIADAFDGEVTDHSFIAPGVLSRKKQVVPRITQAISKAKSE